MPVLSVLAYKVRAAVSVAVGALIFIIPVAPGPPGALGGAGLDQHGATAVQPPAGIPSVAGAGLSSVACTARGACTAGGSYQAAGRQIEPMVATQSRGRWSRGTPLVLPAGAATQPYAQVNGIACHSAGKAPPMPTSPRNKSTVPHHNVPRHRGCSFTPRPFPAQPVRRP